MPRRPCLGLPDQSCPRTTDRPDSRCDTCASAREQRRGRRQARGYDAQHVRTRDQLIRDLAPGTLCVRCGQPMRQGQALDAGHPPHAPLRTSPTSRADHLEHAACNRGARD